MRQRHKFLTFFTVLAFCLSFLPLTALAASFPPPEIISINSEGGGHPGQPLIIGLTPHGTEVLIYIDGRLSGQAQINQEGTPADNFYFQSSQNLATGGHSVFAVAKDRTSLVLSAPSLEQKFYIRPLSAPTMIQPNEETVTGKVKPLLTGLTVSGTKIHIFIDGILNGQTGIVKHTTGTANFAYRPFLNLSVGWHTAWGVAEDEHGSKSPLSNILQFRIEPPLPAPILFKPLVNNKTTDQKPFIVGLAKNDVTVKVYIDKKLNGTFKAVNNKTGTANFAYRPFLPLTPGSHLVYATTMDGRGKESAWSNLVYFTVGRPAAPQVSETAAEEKATVSDEMKDFIALAKLYEIDQSVTVAAKDLDRLKQLLDKKGELNISEAELKSLENLLAGKKAEPKDQVEEQGKGESAKEDKATSSLNEIEEILAGGRGTTSAESGLINESKEQQGKLKLNLVIFILFLLAVVVWIFWVNRELIKERRDRNLSEKSQDDKKEKADDKGDKPDDMFKF